MDYRLKGVYAGLRISSPDTYSRPLALNYSNTTYTWSPNILLEQLLLFGPFVFVYHIDNVLS